jgi:hypothetical protein
MPAGGTPISDEYVIIADCHTDKEARNVIGK